MLGTSSRAVVHHQIPGALIKPVVAIAILVFEDEALVEWDLVAFRPRFVAKYRGRVFASAENILVFGNSSPNHFTEYPI